MVVASASPGLQYSLSTRPIRYPERSGNLLPLGWPESATCIISVRVIDSIKHLRVLYHTDTGFPPVASGNIDAKRSDTSEVHSIAGLNQIEPRRTSTTRKCGGGLTWGQYLYRSW